MNAGGSFTPVTVTVKLCSTVTVPSLTANVTECGPTSAFAGVPLSVAVPLPASTNVNHAGFTGAVSVRVAPASTSAAVTA